MRSRTDIITLVLQLLWVCAIVAVAGYGALIVQNVTEALKGIAHHSASAPIIERPTR